MIESLLNWEVKNKRLNRFGKKIEELNKEFGLLDICMTAPESSTVNLHRARSLQRKISYLDEESKKIDIIGRDKQSSFDRLVLEDYTKNLFTQGEYIKFFFTIKYNRDWGVREFLNYAFLPRKMFEGKENKGAVSILENELKEIKYRYMTKRENLMWDINTFSVSVNQTELSDMLISELPRLRKMIADYNIDMNFITREQVDKENLINHSKELEKTKERMKNFFGNYKGDIPDLIDTNIDRQVTSLKRRLPTITPELSEFIYDLVIGDSGFGSYYHATRTMEISSETFYFYKDQKTNKTKLYLGDIARTLGHENYHRLQWIFSKNMPPGLRNLPGELTLPSWTISEGLSMSLENNFVDWLENNRQRYGISKKDVEIAKLLNHEYFAKKIIRLLHAVYHREESPLEKNEDTGAHLRLAKVTGIQVYADSHYLNDDSMPEVYSNAFYIFGEKYINRTLKELEQVEKRKHGTLRKARNFLKRNEPIILQGRLTGGWGWGTHRDFFLKHYWPKARPYCK